MAQNDLFNNTSAQSDLVVTFPNYNQFGLKALENIEKISLISLNECFNKIINDSTEIIRICSPFIDYEGYKKISKNLCMKLIKGKRVQILTREVFENRSRQKEIRKIIKDLSRCTNNGLEVRNYHYSQNNHVISSIHAKYLSADDKCCYLGSGEVRKNSFEVNLEIGVSISNVNIVQSLNKIFDYLFQVSKEIDLDKFV